MSAIIDQDVLGFDVSVDHSDAMRGGQTLQSLADDTQGLPHGEYALMVHLIPKIHPVHVFHDQIVEPVEHSGVVHLHDMRIGDGRRRTGLTVEAFHELLPLRALRKLSVHDFDGHGTSKTFIDGLVHRGHAAVRDFADNPISAFYDLVFRGM